MTRLKASALSFAIATLVSTSMVMAEDAPGFDGSKPMGVFCMQYLLIAFEAMGRACAWERNAVDDAMDAGLASIDNFIIANSPQPMSKEEVVQSRTDELKFATDFYASHADVCKIPPDTFVEYAWGLHTGNPSRIKVGVAKVIAVPRLPTLEPCLASLEAYLNSSRR